MTNNKSPIFTFESHGDYVYDVGWSPIHPALFAAVDGSGRLDFWNLNKETETPSASIDIDNRTRAINKLKWSRKGTEIVIGDDHGEMRIYEISENFARPENDEYDKLLKTLENLKKLNQESMNFNLNCNTDSNYINYLIESFK
ncbi:cytoplasmic dynein 1 intermediate chain 2-like isoform X5 [Brachionus plicatilis]|uniref:Cytoplasmic dynein 1 intermediate chain 2-like isoform X5 n=1 Tax=Brachionus plicatilis TaxID=10195 RepID=A0A3M7Q9E2_BRAPC|nr:cytoplasmic dynein 1 intermediate chain 2-like isoform X5 [Brachionus plicatilis]